MCDIVDTLTVCGTHTQCAYLSYIVVDGIRYVQRCLVYLYQIDINSEIFPPGLKLF